MPTPTPTDELGLVAKLELDLALVKAGAQPEHLEALKKLWRTESAEVTPS